MLAVFGLRCRGLRLYITLKEPCGQAAEGRFVRGLHLLTIGSIL